MSSSKATFIFAAAATVLAVQANDPWEVLTEGANAWRSMDFGDSFALAVGDAKEDAYLYNSHEQPDPSRADMMTTAIAGESYSKFTTVLMISNMVKAGVISFDDKVNKYLDWWEQDGTKPLYDTTLRHLVTFTSGLTHDVCYGQDPGEQSCFCLKGYNECAHDMYLNATSYTVRKPNTTWLYLSIHLQMAGAMALSADHAAFPKEPKKTMAGLLKEYLYEPFNLTHTQYQPAYFPAMAIGVLSTGHDIRNIVRSVVKYDVVPKSIMDQIEFDYSIRVSGSPKGSTDGWWGHYGMGSWVECLGFGIAPHVNNGAPLKPRCKALQQHSAPGGSGVYPMWDRSGGSGLAGPSRPQYYFGLMVEEMPALTGIPEYFRIIAKPVADLLIGGHDPANVTDAELNSNLGGWIRRDIEYIRSVLKTCSCEHQDQAKHEPYASLLDGLPADDSSKNRNDILQGGASAGLTLRRLIAVSKKLGKCKCEGR